MRLLAVVAILTLAGCVQYESHSSGSRCYANGEEVPCSSSDAANVSASGGTCTVNGERLPCQGSRTPTGARADVHVDDSGNALEGLDRTWTFSVHPNATRAEMRAILHGPADSGVLLGEARYQLIYPGGREVQPCPGSNNVQLGAQVNLLPKTIIDRDGLAVGDWSLRLCIERSTVEYDVSIHVTY